jgi:hypothetical protein
MWKQHRAFLKVVSFRYLVIFQLFLLLFFVTLGFELRASSLLGRCSYCLSHSASPFGDFLDRPTLDGLGKFCGWFFSFFQCWEWNCRPCTGGKHSTTESVFSPSLNLLFILFLVNIYLFELRASHLQRRCSTT